MSFSQSIVWSYIHTHTLKSIQCQQFRMAEEVNRFSNSSFIESQNGNLSPMMRKSADGRADDGGINIPPVQLNKALFPYCIVWSPLPPITWILPFIGHMGIANSRGRTFLDNILFCECKSCNYFETGIIHDFAGPYHIGIGDFAFGAPTRYLLLSPSLCHSATWDEGVESGSQEYTKHMHNICCDNCHSHVARCLNDMRYDNRIDWNMIILGVKMFFFGRFTDTWGFVKTFLPFFIFITLVLYFTGQFSQFDAWCLCDIDKVISQRPVVPIRPVGLLASSLDPPFCIHSVK